MRFVPPILVLTLFATSVALAGGGSIFRDADTYPADDGLTFRITGGDFNRDGKTDLAATNEETPFFTVSVFLGKGSKGKFADAVPFIGGGDGADIESGRFGKDRNPDLAVTDSDNNTVEVFAGNGDGTFDFDEFDSYPGFSGPYGLDVARLPGDRWPDIVVANSGAGGVDILYGKRNGTFEDPVGFDAGDADDDVVVSDLNRDGVPDIATSSFTDQVLVLIGKPNGEYKEAEPYSVVDGPSSVAAGDLNGDGRPDLAVSNRTSSDVAVLLGRNNGFKAADYFDVQDGDLQQSRIAIDDLDGDGKQDVAIAFETGVGLQVMRGRGDGRLRDPIEFEGASNAAGLVLGSFRPGDGPDAAVTDAQDDGAIAVFNNR